MDRFTRADWIGATLGAIIGFIAAIPQAFPVLLGLQIIDFTSGMAAAGKAGTLSSGRGWRGLTKKLQTWFWIGSITLIELILPTGIWPQIAGVGVSPSVAAAGMYAGLEFVSIAENVGLSGVNIGPFRRLLHELRRDPTDGPPEVKPT